MDSKTRYEELKIKILNRTATEQEADEFFKLKDELGSQVIVREESRMKELGLT